MAKELPIEIFMPPNMLKAKVGGSLAGLDAAMIRRAEAAMEDLKTEFTSWLSSDVDRLLETRDRFAALCETGSQADLFRAAHDLKGGAKTYEFPLIARMASSLARLIEGFAADALPLALVDAHVNAIRILYRDNVKDGANRTAILLTEELEARVTEALERAR